MNDTPPTLAEVFGPVIFSYTRKHALADGFQVDVTATAQEAGKEGGGRRAAAFAWNLEGEGLGERADEEPPRTVFEFGPILVGPQNLDGDVVADAPQVRPQQFAGEAAAERRHILEHHGCGHALTNQSYHREEQVAGVAQFRFAGQAFLRSSKIRVAGAGNAADKHVKLRQF